jgi:type I restriction enzyme, S subunit
MSKWKEYKLGDISDYINRGVTPLYSEDGVIVINQKCVRDGQVKYEQSRYTNSEKKKITEEKYLKPFDILINSTGQGTLGRVGQVKEITTPTTVDSHLTIVRIKKNINPVFLGYVLKSKQSLIEDLAEGTTGQTELSRHKVAGIPILLPDLPTQTSIAEILSSLDDKIELNNKINNELESLAQILFKQWFIDFEFPNENGEPYKSSGGEMIESELGEIPKGWGVGSIYEVSDVIYGAPFKSKLFNQERKGFPLIRIRDMKTFQPQNWTEEVLPKGTKIVAGDLIVGMDAEFRPIFWLGQPAWLNQRLCYFNPKKGFPKLFVREIIRPQLAFYENSSVGTTVIHLGKADIDTFKSIIPNETVMGLFEEISNSIFEKIINNSKEKNQLTYLRDTLLPKLISGDLGLKNVKF